MCFILLPSKLRRIGVPTQVSSSRHLSKLWYLSWVDARYWKPIIVYTRFPIHSQTQVCLITTRIPCPYSTLYSTSNKGRLSSYFQITIPGPVIYQRLMPSFCALGLTAIPSVQRKLFVNLLQKNKIKLWISTLHSKKLISKKEWFQNSKPSQQARLVKIILKIAVPYFCFFNLKIVTSGKFV